MNSDLQAEADLLGEMLSGRVVRIVRRHSPSEVMIEFHDGTRLYVNQSGEGLDFSITGDDEEVGVERVLAS